MPWSVFIRRSKNEIKIKEAIINDAATKIRVFFLSFLLETVFVEPARTRYTKVSKVHYDSKYNGGILHKKDLPYNLCKKNLCKLPAAKSLMFGTSSLSFKGSLLWNTLRDNVKGAIIIQKFKKEIRHWDGKNCTYHICT